MCVCVSAQLKGGWNSPVRGGSHSVWLHFIKKGLFQTHKYTPTLMSRRTVSGLVERLIIEEFGQILVWRY